MKKRVMFYIEPDLWEFAKWYAKRNATSAAQVIRDHLVRLRREAMEKGEIDETTIDNHRKDS